MHRHKKVAFNVFSVYKIEEEEAIEKNKHTFRTKTHAHTNVKKKLYMSYTAKHKPTYTHT